MKSTKEKIWVSQFVNIFFYKFLTVFFSFLIPSLLINKIGIEKYGVWSILLTLISWLSIVDIGFGNSLRYRLSGLLLVKNYLEIKRNISAAYFSLGLIILIVGSIILFYSNYINFQNLFNTKQIPEIELQLMFNFSVSLILFNFWLNLINPLLYVSHLSHLISLSNFLSTLIVLIILYIVLNCKPIKLYEISIIHNLTQVIITFLLSLWFFFRNKFFFGFAPFSFSLVKDIIIKGSNFFIIQVAGLVVFSTDKFLISQFYGSQYIGKFDISLKYFSLLFLFHTIISTPLWSLYSEAFKLRDYKWINKTLGNQVKYFFLFSFFGIIMFLFSNVVYKIWINKEFSIDDQLNFSVLIYTLVMVWNNIFATVLNGIGQEKIQLNSSFLAIFLNVFLALFFIFVLHLGYVSVVVSSILSSLIPAFHLPFKVKSYLSTVK
jgi:O-antigen/teichoic acid export membrane protein